MPWDTDSHRANETICVERGQRGFDLLVCTEVPSNHADRPDRRFVIDKDPVSGAQETDIPRHFELIQKGIGEVVGISHQKIDRHQPFFALKDVRDFRIDRGCGLMTAAAEDEKKAQRIAVPRTGDWRR